MVQLFDAIVDQSFMQINSVLHYLWRAVDQDGDELAILVQKRRNRKAAMKFFKKLLKGQQAAPLKVVTDKLRSYSAARGTSCPVLSILPNNTKTTAVNYLISQGDSRNGRCGGLNHKGRLNDFYRVTVLSITCLDLADII